jgi:membrane-bound lytic murein transglycosylase D
VTKGETLAAIAAASGMSVTRLAAANGWNGAHAVARGDLVRIPLPASRADAAGQAPALVAENAPAAATPAEGISPQAPPPSAEPPAAPEPTPVHPPEPAVEKAPPPPREPVSQKQTGSAALLPAGSPTGGTDTTNYGVSENDTVVVQAEETLGHFSDWTGIDSQTLRTLNKLHKSAQVTLGRKIKLDFSRVSAAQFTEVRRDYHHHLQEAFFAAHRIAGTENYTVKRGDSLWTIARQHGDLPLWLVTQYNPDADFNDMRLGATITLPQVAEINRQ